jgi:hypothetical protein
MDTLQQRLLRGDRTILLRFLSQLISQLTILARSHYDHPQSQRLLVETNEAVHRLAGHLRDLVDAGEPLTESRAEAISAHADLLSSLELERLVVWSKI